jgi:hypothetical protein
MDRQAEEAAIEASGLAHGIRAVRQVLLDMQEFGAAPADDQVVRALEGLVAATRGALAEAVQRGHVPPQSGTATLSAREGDLERHFYRVCEAMERHGVKVTDYVFADELMREYKGLTQAQAVQAAASIEPGDWDDVINKDGRRDILDKAVQDAGYDTDAAEAEPEAAAP